MTNGKRNPLKGLKIFLSDLFDLHEDKQREQVTIEEISKGVEFKGTNLWILIFAILIASIGLNVNSTAVIIGAMLISPLMGPIMGIGLGAGINDFDLIKKAMINLAIAVFISVGTSAVYFIITPLHEAQSELLARTYPTLWDVLIAFFGGMAGIVAGSRKEKTNAVPGVAIATALMPPLCTAGYALANLNWYFFFGAFYLFFINSVFITVATFLIVRFLRYPKKTFESAETEKTVKRYIAFFVVITIIPSIYLAFHLVKKTVFEQNARNFISVEFNFEDTEVINHQFDFDLEESMITVTLYGKPLDETVIKEIEKHLPLFDLSHTTLNIHQGYVDDPNITQEFERMSSALRVELIENLYQKNADLLESKDEKLKLLEDELIKAQGKHFPISDISNEMKIHYNTVAEFGMSEFIQQNMSTNQIDTMCYAVVKFSKKPIDAELKKMEAWLKVRTKEDSLILLVQ